MFNFLILLTHYVRLTVISVPGVSGWWGHLYADGMTAPRISVTGTQLPLPRIVSRTVHPDEGFHDHAGTVLVVAWGQFMDHDYTLTATPLGQ